MSREAKNKNPIKNSHARPDAIKEIDDGVILKVRFWLEKDGDTYLASGRIDLLKKLDELGSISAAAEAMGISYHHAWNLIDKMNTLSKEPLITTSQGGKGGGGTELTPKGKRVVERFEKFQASFQELVSAINLSFSEDES